MNEMIHTYDKQQQQTQHSFPMHKECAHSAKSHIKTNAHSEWTVFRVPVSGLRQVDMKTSKHVKTLGVFSLTWQMFLFLVHQIAKKLSQSQSQTKKNGQQMNETKRNET